MSKQYPLPLNAESIRGRIAEMDDEQDELLKWSYEDKIALYRLLMSDTEDALEQMVRRTMANLVKHGPLNCPEFSDEHEHLICYECADTWPCTPFIMKSGEIQMVNMIGRINNNG